ncbi:MAG: hypothetical protein J5J06_12825, partial [Phycisphaerae bacterium]|nr:hypothetical protein [Phycisphaerae bacterium]
ATELPGWEGTHAIQIDVEDAPKGQDADFWSCSINVGKQQWLTFTPLVDGIATFSTCNPGTTYDTVVRALTGNCAESLLVLDCVDDSLIPSCDTGCDSSGPRGTIAEFPVEAGVPYYVEVGSYNDNASGCDLCLDATLQIESYCTLDPTPPLVEITSPADSECVCGMVPITGTATDPESPLREYRIEYRPLGGNWSLIGSDTGPVSAGSFGEWNTSGLSQGWYVLRLTATNACGLSASVVRIVRLDGYFETLIIHEPAHATVVGGSVCFDGSASDDCFDQYVVWYRPIGGTFVPVDPSQPIYGSGVLNDALASWDTTGLGLPDGSYELELAGTTICGNGAAQTIFVDVDNTAPTAVITSPMNCDSVDGIVDIVGTAADANLAGWSLSYTGGNTNSWVPIASGTGNVSGSTLAQWNTAGLPPCAYTLRLVVEDSAAVNCSSALHHRTEYLTTVAIGWPGDFDWDNDGDVDLVDYQAFEAMFDGPNVP